MKKKPDKTNVMRILDQHKAAYTAHFYGDGEALGGVEVAAALGEPPERVYKTLVTVGAKGNHYVFMVPVNAALDLKKAARAVGEKNIMMIRQNELLPLTGYIHGGCSPIGMKKLFRTTIDSGAADHDHIFFSAGRIGAQIETTLDELRRIVPVELYDITEVKA